jgi:hypothetical protein
VQKKEKLIFKLNLKTIGVKNTKLSNGYNYF